MAKGFKVKIIKISTFLLLSSFTQLSWAQYNLEVKGGYESWSTGKDGGSAQGIVGGAGIGYYKDKYFVGGGLVLGEYNFDNNDKTIARNDIDLVVGYKVDSQLSLFTGYRFNQTDYKSKADPSLNEKENTLGLGGGASFAMPVARSVIVFGTAAISGLYSYNNLENNGTGYSLGTEAGVLYSFNPKVSVALRAKYQMSSISKSTEDWKHSYVRFGAHLGYLF